MKTSLKGFKLVAISSAVRGIRRACLAARLKMQEFLSFFFFLCVLAKREVMILFLAETVETGDKNRDVTDNMFRAPCMFCEESLGKINAKDVELFRNGSVHGFCRLKASIIGRSEYFNGPKKKNLYGQNFNVHLL